MFRVSTECARGVWFASPAGYSLMIQPPARIYICMYLYHMHICKMHIHYGTFLMCKRNVPRIYVYVHGE